MLVADSLLYTIAFLLLVRRAMCYNWKKELSFLLLFLAAGAALAVYENASLAIMLAGIMVFNGMASSYHSRENYAFFVLAILFIMPIYAMTLLISQSMLLGLLSCAYFFSKPAKRTSVAVERRRDAIQVVMGLALICAFALFAALYVKVAIILAILLGSVVGNYSVRNKKSAISKRLHALERKDAVLGQGAVWLTVGTLVALSFLNSGQIIAVLAAVFVGDAVATIVGTTYKHPLPYNKGKSVEGTLAYFFVAALLSFPFIGYAGVAAALVGALVESSPKHVDDNFDTALALTLLLLLFGYAGIAH